MSNPFFKAVKHQAKLRLAIAGPSGSGKTYTSLAVATELANGGAQAKPGTIALIDTEPGSANKYADLFDVDVLEMSAPFHPDRFVEAIQAAAKAKYAVLILDSLSHAWNGSGGVLELVEQFSKRYKGNSYAAWGDVTPIHSRLVEAIIAAPMHVIGTMRSKQDYILVERNGKQIPQKVGMAPIQRDGFEYEFDVFLDMDIENNAIVAKTRCPALTGKVLPKPGADLAAMLLQWLGGPAPARNGRNGQASPRELLWDIVQPTFMDVAKAAAKAGLYDKADIALEALEEAPMVVETGASVKASGKMSGPAAAVKLFDQLADLAAASHQVEPA